MGGYHSIWLAVAMTLSLYRTYFVYTGKELG